MSASDGGVAPAGDAATHLQSGVAPSADTAADHGDAGDAGDAGASGDSFAVDGSAYDVGDSRADASNDAPRTYIKRWNMDDGSWGAERQTPTSNSLHRRAPGRGGVDP